MKKILAAALVGLLAGAGCEFDDGTGTPAQEEVNGAWDQMTDEERTDDCFVFLNLGLVESRKSVVEEYERDERPAPEAELMADAWIEHLEEECPALVVDEVWKGMSATQQEGACVSYRTVGAEKTAAIIADSYYADGEPGVPPEAPAMTEEWIVHYEEECK